MTDENWWQKFVTLATGGSYSFIRTEYIPEIIAEAERRGYERAMEEVKKAIITTADALLSGGTENEERFEAVIIPKSVFEKV